MKKLVSIVLVSLAAPLLRAEFSAGFARLDITPPPGLPMPGHFHKRIADGVLDPLCVECIAVSDGTNDALIYSVDDLQLPGPFFEKAFPAITAATGVPRDRIYVHSTHTHTGVSSMLGEKVAPENQPIVAHTELRITKLADAGRAALSNRAPATIAIGQTECKGISFIRRYRMKDGSVRTNPGQTNPDVAAALGTPDESLRVVRFKRKSAPDIAIVNFGTHPDSIGGTKYSADWRCRAPDVRERDRWRREVPLPQRCAGRREPLHALPATGASGASRSAAGRNKPQGHRNVHRARRRRRGDLCVGSL